MDQQQPHHLLMIGRGSSSTVATLPGSEPISNCYVRGLPLDVDEAMLSSLFEPFGSVQSVRIFRSNQVGDI